jgi:hypothetical protein
LFHFRLLNNHKLNLSVPLTSKSKRFLKIIKLLFICIKINLYIVFIIDTQKTLGANLYQNIDLSSERLLKLAPYPILDTDPGLKNLNFSSKLSRYPHSIGNMSSKLNVSMLLIF